MKYREFGLGQKETILLLHGGGLSWWNYLEAAKLLQTDFHIILPILDGHAGSDRPFTTIDENASEIISFIDAQFGTSVLMIGGPVFHGSSPLACQRKCTPSWIHWSK